MKGAGDLPEKQEVQPVAREAISSEEITAALTKRCPVGSNGRVDGRIRGR